MSEHTPGKLAVEEMLMIGTDSTTMIADCSCAVSRDSWSGSDYATRAHREANARRLVAAWNACDGLSTEQLERAGTLDRASVSRNVAISNTIKNLTAERDSLRAVNAELLEALEKARSGLSNGLWDYGPGQDEHAQCNELIEEVDAAIASARKQGEQT